MGEIKTYRIEGFMLISQDKLPRWAKFVKEIRALNPEHALEKLYSEMGSRHKVKRTNIRVANIREIDVGEARSRYIRELARLTYMVVE
ncbi:MAG: 50S ribosomal protein L18Ae [Ignisphaera sp.]|nr:50S ribosomal protein L18Ae [Ignisphaera sp.]MCX8168318.1 50S ribosomal protein L18Ae [Ignisphaera sp.]MDW8085350.1 50S ribosomal protein L18Ae [Ignisphaera sp.]